MERKVRKCIPMMRKTPDFNYDHGQFNGYIAIPYELWDRMTKVIKFNHPNYGFDTRMHYEMIPTEIYYPHGGFTFGCQYNDFSEDTNFIPMLDIRKVDTRNYFVIGFDTCHAGDTDVEWNAKTVREEVFTLYKSIQDYIKVRY